MTKLQKRCCLIGICVRYNATYGSLIRANDPDLDPPGAGKLGLTRANEFRIVADDSGA